MAVIQTKIQVESTAFTENQASMLAQIDNLRITLAKIELGGPDAARERHAARGKLLPRDRVLKLIDKETEFLEFSQLAAYNVYGEDVPASGIITGIGRVNGLDCIIIVNDATVKGGTYYPITCLLYTSDAADE